MNKHKKVPGRKTIVIIDESTYKLKCLKCSGVFSPMIKPGGGMYRGYKNCPHCGNKE